MIRTLLMTVSFLCFLQTVAFADNDFRESREHHTQYMPRDLHDLKLTRTQHQSIEKALRENMKLLRKLRDKEHRFKKFLRKLFLSDDFDTRAYYERAQKLSREKIRIEAQLFKAIHRVLTPKQREMFVRQLEEWEID